MRMGRFKKLCVVSLALGMMLPTVVSGSGDSVNAATGTWKHDQKGWWYSYSDGSYAKDEWVKYSGKWYYFKKNGYMATGWIQYGGKWYYFGKNGIMVTGWKKIDGKWYYFNTNGAARKGWLRDTKTSGWYYLGGNYAMVTGWKKIGSKWSYFQPDGLLTVGWFTWKDNSYYFDENGEMVTGSRTIYGVKYTFDEEGVLLPGGGGIPEVGSWDNPIATDLTDEEIDEFLNAEWDSEITEQIYGDITVMAGLGSREQNGTDRRYLCKFEPHNGYGYKKYMIATLHSDPDGTGMITKAVFAPSPIPPAGYPGAYNDPESILLSSTNVNITRAKTAFDQVKDSMVGYEYTASAVLSVQVVSGANYRILCFAKDENNPDSDMIFAIAVVYVGLDEDVTLSSIEIFGNYDEFE